MMATKPLPVDAKVFMQSVASSTGDVTKVLDLSRRQDVTLDTKDGSGRNSLDLARQHGDLTAMRTLATVDGQLRLLNNTTPITNRLLERTTDPIAHLQNRDSLRVVQLYGAARFGDLDLLQYALRVLEADVDRTTADGASALKTSILKDDVVALKCLLSAGAKVGEEDVQLAESIGNQFILNLLDVCRTADE